MITVLIRNIFTKLKQRVDFSLVQLMLKNRTEYELVQIEGEGAQNYSLVRRASQDSVEKISK
jgi:hypothetical protein